MRFVSTRAFGALVLVALTVVALTGATAFAGSSGKGGGGLSKHDRELLAQAKAAGKDNVVLIIAAKGGANRDVVKGIEAEGGSILNKDDSLGYVLARVATDKVQAIAGISGIQALDLDEVIPLDDPRPAGQVTPTPQTPPSAATPRATRTCRSQDTGAAQFTAAHPTWDGRGVTIGIVDTGIDARSPEPADHQHGRAQDHRLGHRHRSVHATTIRPGSTWRTRSRSPAARSPSAPSTYTARRRRHLSHSRVFNERDPRLGGEVGSDVNRDGNRAGSSGIFARAVDTTSTTRSASTPTRTAASPTSWR